MKQEPAQHSPEVIEACARLNDLCAALGDRAGEDPMCQHWFRRLLQVEPASFADVHAREAVAMKVLPKPFALTPDGRPLFTVAQLAEIFGVGLGSLVRRTPSASSPSDGQAPH